VPLKILIPPRGPISAQNVTLKILIEQAYSVRPHQIVGGPEWIARDRFNVSAKPPDDAPSGRAREMLRALLADRFALHVRRETRSLPVYALVLARDDGTFGKLLRPSKHDCAAYLASEADPTADDAPRNERGGPACRAGFITGPQILLTMAGASMAEVASRLEQHVDRAVVDKTGLMGAFDADLFFATPQGLTPLALTSGSRAPDIFAVVQQQLGLKLRSETGAVDVLVIESVDKPTPN
jgi:uncharacterized protein (TIGR03435 family)